MISNLLVSVISFICVTLIFLALIKSPHAWPILVIILCIAWVFAGFNSGINMYKYYSTESKTNGELVVKDPYEDFNYYEYSLKDFSWYKSEDGNYYYHKNYATSLEFDGTNESYVLLVDNVPCKQTESQNGRLKGYSNIKFYDVDNNLRANIDLTISFTFYASNIDLRIDTNATDKGILLLNEYIKVNGFNLRIINKVYTNNEILKGELT